LKAEEISKRSLAGIIERNFLPFLAILLEIHPSFYGFPDIRPEIDLKLRIGRVGCRRWRLVGWVDRDAMMEMSHWQPGPGEEIYPDDKIKAP
jgi:hypothetical protein